MTAPLTLAAAALIAAVLYAAVRAWVPAYAPLIAAAAAVCMAALLAGESAGRLLDLLRGMEAFGGTEAFRCLFKAAGIVLAAEYSRNLCRDAGLSSAAVCVEFCGRCLVLLTAWPIFSAVLSAVAALSA